MFNYQFAIHSPLLDGQNLCNRHKNSFFNHICLGFSAGTLPPVKNTIAICRGLKGKLKCMRILSCLKSLESSMLFFKKNLLLMAGALRNFYRNYLRFPCGYVVFVWF